MEMTANQSTEIGRFRLENPPAGVSARDDASISRDPAGVNGRYERGQNAARCFHGPSLVEADHIDDALALQPDRDLVDCEHLRTMSRRDRN